MEIFDSLLMDFASPLSWRVALERLGSSLALSSLIAFFHLRYSQSRLGRNTFAFSILILGMGSSLLAGIIASSVALSIGMVGSISIIRFRTRLNEPRQLILVFLAMAACLGIGLEKALFSWVATLSILIIWGIKSSLDDRSGIPANLLVKTENPGRILKEINKLNVSFHLVEFFASENKNKLRLQIDRAPRNFPERLSESFRKIPGTIFEFEFTEDEG